MAALLTMAIRLSPLAVALTLSACTSGLGASAASACDRVAARQGSDGNPGTVARPFRTAQRLANALRPGQTGCLRAGTYDQRTPGGYVLKFFHGGKPGRRIHVQSFPGERATLKGVVYFPRQSPHVRLSGLDISGRARWLRDDVVTVQVMGSDVVFDDNTVTNDRLKSCMIMGSNEGWGQARSVVIRRNEFFRCGDPGHGRLDHGIYVENSLASVIADNVFRGIAGYAVHLYPNAQRTRVVRNVMTDNGGGVIFGGDWRLASSGNLVAQNVIADSHSDYSLSESWDGPVGTGNVARDNCLWGTGADGLGGHGGGFAALGNRELDPELVGYRPGKASPCSELVGPSFAAGARR